MVIIDPRHDPDSVANLLWAARDAARQCVRINRKALVRGLVKQHHAAKAAAASK